MSGKAASWTAGTVVLALILIAGGWFGLISPKLEATAEIVTETEDVQARNDLLVIQNAKLASDFAKLDEYKASIAEVAVKLPPAVELAELTRTIAKVAEDHELTVVTLAPSTPVVVPSTASDEATGGAAPAPEAEDVEGAEGDTAESTPAPEPVAPSVVSLPAVSISGLVAVPVATTLVGTVEGVEDLLTDLQTTIDRTFLVTGMTFTGQEEADAAGGRPETAEGDVEVVLTAYVFVLEDVERTLAELEQMLQPVVPVDPSELPKSKRNPFPRIAGSDAANSDSDEAEE